MISAIICTYNRERFIVETLKKLTNTSFSDYEVILVDNNSTDGTAALVKDFIAANPDKDIKYFFEEKQGLSNARNRGMQEAAGDVFLFLDDDSFVCEGYLEKLSAALTENPQAGAFGGRIDPLFESGKAPFWLSRWSMGWVSAINLGDKPCEFEGKVFPIGANMGIKRKVIQECGQFNPELGRCGGNMNAGEEKDLFRRVREHGFSIWYFPEVKVDHVIPEKRTTLEYVDRFADGVGASERTRTKQNGTYLRRLLLEAVKWAGTLILYLWYLIRGKKDLGATLVRFRAHVTRHLLREQE